MLLEGTWLSAGVVWFVNYYVECPIERAKETALGKSPPTAKHVLDKSHKFREDIQKSVIWVAYLQAFLDIHVKINTFCLFVGCRSSHL